MKKLSLALMASAIISFPICSMEIEKKISPNAKICLKIIEEPNIKIFEWQALFMCYAYDKDRVSGYEQCAELIDDFINKKASKENCTVALRASIFTPELDRSKKYPKLRIEMMQKLIARQADPNPALKQLAQNMSLHGPNYCESHCVDIFTTLWEAKAFDEEAIESFKSGYELFVGLYTAFEQNRPK